MHKFVDMSAPDGSWGLSLINEGKYGFDTRGGSSINLSLHKTAEYPPPNAGSWAHIERDIRKDLDWGEVPKYVGLRPISCRFSYYPHKGGTYGKEKGVKIPRVNKKAEEFNNPILVSGNRLHPKNAKAPSPLFSLCSTLSFQTSPNLQIKALKRMEWKYMNSLVLRVVDRTGPGGNIKDKKNTTPSFVKLPVILKNKVQMVRSLDLLEREIEASFEWDSEENNISYNSRNFEVRTFALDLRG